MKIIRQQNLEREYQLSDQVCRDSMVKAAESPESKSPAERDIDTIKVG